MVTTDARARGKSRAKRASGPTRPGARLDAAKVELLTGAEGASLATLRTAARDCNACPLWRRATQTVFGEGPQRASLVLIGEQPGDQEDLAGHPFVGPSGRLLDTALAEVGLDRRQIYVTNAVKHFKWIAGEGRGKRRLLRIPEAAGRAQELRRFSADLRVAAGLVAG
jgi:uracil-DNA glycosylase